MSSVVASTSAALGRHFIFDDETKAEVRSDLNAHPRDAQSAIKNSSIISLTGNRKSKIENSLVPASRLEIRPIPEMISSGIPELDALTGGWPRGCLTEICGQASSGRTTLLLASLAATSRRGEFCAVVDAGDALDPISAVDAGVELERLLWVRCEEGRSLRHKDTEKDFWKSKNQRRNTNSYENRLERVLRATDLLLESGGFGMIVLDLADLPLQSVRRIPLTTWFRFRRAIEHTPTILLSIEEQAIAGSCSSLLLQLGSHAGIEMLSHSASGRESEWGSPARQYGAAAEKENNSCCDDAFRKPPTHARLLTGLPINAELIRSRLDRKPVRSIAFETKTAWAG